jgi:hypothetical protein
MQAPVGSISPLPQFAYHFDKRLGPLLDKKLFD